MDHATRSGRHRAVDGVDLDLFPGEVLALVGESGSGKSTTARAILGLSGRARVGGRILLHGSGGTRTDVLTATERRLRQVRGGEIGFVPQDPAAALNPVQRVGAQVAEAVRLHHRTDRAGARTNAVRLLGEAGLPDPARIALRLPHELSGGMRQRVLVAMALAGGPRLLVADEPTSALDATVQHRLLDHLDHLRSEQNLSMLLITHDLGVAADRAHRIAVMSAGRIVEQGPADAVLHRPGHTYTRALLEAAPGLDDPTGADAPRTDPNANDGPPLVRVENLIKDYGGPEPAVAGVDLTLERGRTYALVGESGSGKTTTARTVIGLTRPTSGSVLFDGVDLTSLRGSRLRRMRRRFQVVYQDPYASLDPRTGAAASVAEPLRAFRVGDRAWRRARAVELLDRVGLHASTADRRPGELSGGQLQRVAIARALALEPDLVVCDEPVSALDVRVQARILDLLAELQRDLGVAYLFISHDLAVVRRVAHRVGVMHRGRIVEEADVRTLFAAPEHEHTHELLAAVPGRARAHREIPV
ncbi:ABC transporter ATP-binding protein [Nocardiopsis coralli]|uniref:ABC transporter ATP-binding protein n=1 Tax=Nocardiopsis coralli TaxID=2772213 RepID=UPI002E2BED8D|nr:ABC transporter ATP-binding protein [Nocardiopsis coralli]